MSFNWTEYLLLAEVLAKTPVRSVEDETQYRCAIRRAHYAAFITSLDFITNTLGVSLGEDEDVHRYVRDHFDNWQGREYRQFSGAAKSLNRLRHSRNRCDYDGIYNPKEKDVKKAISEARRVINMLDSYSRSA